MLDDAEFAALMSLVCGGALVPGEQLEAASPADPSFWPIHAATERLLHYKRLVAPFADERWAAPEKSGSSERPTTEFCAYHARASCAGHHDDDLVGWSMPLLARRGGGGASSAASSWEPSNGELLALSDPASSDYALPYVYDSFTWPHCDSTPFSFPQISTEEEELGL